MLRRAGSRLGIALLMTALFAAIQLLPAQSIGSEGGKPILIEAGLEECIGLALKNSHLRPASLYAVAIAEAQHRQALSGYWPQIGLQGGYQRMDESSNFLFPATSIELPMGGSLPVIIPNVGTVPVNSISIPAQNIKLMDRDSFAASLGFTWLLFDGGMRRGFREQTGSLIEMMKQEARRTDLEIVDSVKRMYFGSVLSIQLHNLGKDTLARMEATLTLTETLYKEGSGMVKKTDWLDNKIMVESLRAMVALLEKNEVMAQAALANTMGMPWNSSTRPADKELPFFPFRDKLDDLVGTAYEFNPDWAIVEAGIRAAEGAVRTAESGHYPKVAVTGELHKWWNKYDAGLATDSNKEGWMVGVGVEIPLFDGFLTSGKVAETRARMAKIREQQYLLKEGIGLMIRDTFLTLAAAEKSYQATLDAKNAAEENRDLNTRAYQQELVESEKVIRSQLMEALMAAQHYKTLYDHNALCSRLNLIVGTEVMRKLERP